MGRPTISIKYDHYLKQSDERTFTEIYKLYWKPMYALAVKQLQCEDTAKDCVQEVFVALWKRRDEQHITNLESYLLQSVRFQARKAMRNKQMNRLRCMLDFASSSHSFSDPAMLRDMQAGFYRAISTLPEDQRRIFYMNREEAATYPRIAARLGISVKTVEKKMSLTLKALRNKLKWFDS